MLVPGRAAVWDKHSSKSQTEKGGWWVQRTLRKTEQGTESRKRRVGGDVREGREAGTEKAEVSRSSRILASIHGGTGSSQVVLSAAVI